MPIRQGNQSVGLTTTKPPLGGKHRNVLDAGLSDDIDDELNDFGAVRRPDKPDSTTTNASPSRDLSNQSAEPRKMSIETTG